MTSVPRQSPKKNDTRKYSLASWIKGYAAWCLVFPMYLALWAFAATFKRVPNWMLRKLLREHIGYTHSHPMDMRIPPVDDIPAYMHRWWRVPRNAYMNVYYHMVLRSDEDRALHDHPWWNFSIVLEGGYFEHTIDAGGINRKVWYPAGSVRFRRAGTFAHRLELQRLPMKDAPLLSLREEMAYDGDRVVELPVATIFITGPVLRRWGFHHPERWVDAYDWDSFMADKGVKTMPMGGGSDAVLSNRNQL